MRRPIVPTRLAPGRLTYSLAAVALMAATLIVSPYGFGHPHACAHDLSQLCVGDDDLIDKGNYVYAAAEPGVPGPAPAGMEDAVGATIIGHANPGGFNADVVAHDGYAYMGSWGTLSEDPNPFCPSQGVRAFDLSDPSNPTLVSTFGDGAGDPAVAGSWTEKVIVDRVRTRDFRGDIAAVSFQNCVADGFRGFGVYDVTDPANPLKLALVETDERAQGSHEIWLEARRGKAYVYTAIILSEFLTSDDGVTPGEDKDLQIWDVSDPMQPQQVGEWGAWEELGVPPIAEDDNGVNRVNFVHSVQQERTTLYVSYWDLGTVMLDMTDPADPQFLARTEVEADEAGNSHSSWTTLGGRLLVQTDEDFDPAPGDGTPIEQAWGYTRFFDNRDPANPRQIAQFELPTTRQNPPPGPGFYTVHDPKIRGRNLYLSYYAEGVLRLDILNPTAPRVTGQFLPPPSEDPFGFFGEPGTAFVNVWGTFATKDYILASDINSGLYVFRYDDQG